jgi:hypothetical protein
MMFQGINEYMTFQLILSFPRDYEWPNSIGTLSKSFMLELLKQDADQRLGTRSYDDMKHHDFFVGPLEDGTIEWGRMHTIDPPPQAQRRVLSEPKYDGANPTWMLEDIKEDMDNAKDAEAMSLGGLHRASSEGMMTEQSDGGRGTVGASATMDEVLAGNWNGFLYPGERVVIAGLVGKKNRAWVTRKRYLLVIEGGKEPRFLYIDPNQLTVKGDIKYHPSMKVELKTADRWTLEIPGRTFLWMCLDDVPAKDWVDAVLNVINVDHRSR